jgi:hypothetical protein
MAYKTMTSDTNGVIRSREGQMIQWPKEKGQKDNTLSTKHYTENK